MKRMFLFIILLINSLLTNAQELVCRVQNRAKQPVHNATMVVSLSGIPATTTTVDSGGYYKSALAVPGYYDVKVYASGCDTQIMTGVMLSPNKRMPLTITLAEAKGTLPKTRTVSYEGRNRTIEYPMFSIYDRDIAIKTEQPIHTQTDITRIPLFIVKKVPSHLDTLDNTSSQLLSIFATSNQVKKRHPAMDWVKRITNRL